MTSKAIKWSVGSVIALVVAIAVVYVFSESPRRTFEYLVVKPAPQSVQSIQEGGFRTMDSVFRVLHFNIAAQDMRKILDSEGYKCVAQSEMEGWDRQAGKMVTIPPREYLKHWEERILQTTKLKVHIGGDWQAYTLKDPPHGQKYIFSSTNLAEAVFIADAH